MIISTLVDNKSYNSELGSQHGLSLYVETKKHRLLIDMGANELFLDNAIKMGIDLSEVDLAIISHGHYDHGGGLSSFLSINDKAKVYLHTKAFAENYVNRPGGEKNYIGLDVSLSSSDRLIFVERDIIIDEELRLFSQVKGKRLYPSGNDDLLMKIDGKFLHDDFSHEQNLIINEDGKTVLIAGCAHNGIVNIVEHYKEETETYPDFIIGGFHLYNRSANRAENPDVVRKIGEYLLETGSMCLTCHCTGDIPFNQLKDVLGGKIGYLSSGTRMMI